jgi:hypothetical protein
MRSSLMLALVAIGCGGAVTTVDGNENTANLTPADQDQLCLDTYNYVRNAFSTDDLAKLECGFSQTQSQDPSACNSAYAACLTNARANVQQIQWPLAPDCTGFDQQVAACNTTVGQYSKCLQQELDVVKALEGSFPLCTQAAEQSAAIAAAGKLSQDCIALLNTCHPSFVPGKNATVADAGGGG